MPELAQLVRKLMDKPDETTSGKLDDIGGVASVNPTKTTNTQKVDSMQREQNDSSRRDQFLQRITSEEQVEVLKWAEKNNITRDDPAWLLVDMLGYTRHYTETLPNRIQAACQSTISAIAQQRKAEGEAFAYKSMQLIDELMTEMTKEMAIKCEQITDSRLRNQLRSHGLLVTAGVLSLASINFVLGYILGGANIHWIDTAIDNVWLRPFQIIFGIPIGYLVLPLLIAGLIALCYQIMSQR